MQFGSLLPGAVGALCVIGVIAIVAIVIRVKKRGVFSRSVAISKLLLIDEIT